MRYRVGIIGCGKIFPRHIEAINKNKDYHLNSICDTNRQTLDNTVVGEQVKRYQNYKDMIDAGDINFVVVATPNALHFEHCLYAIKNKCDVLVEKPAVLDPLKLSILEYTAKQYSQKIYAVLQVRLNSTVKTLKYLIDNKIIGEVRGFSLVQRWQRPREYFDDWRGVPALGGGVLHECGIHYLDILCYLLGKPNVLYAKTYNTKHKDVEVEDTVYASLDFGNFGGTMEVTIACEPHNLECSLSLLTDLGYIKLGGKAMNIVEDMRFGSKQKNLEVKNIINSNSDVGVPNSYGSYAGSCPNHPSLYENMKNFTLQETKNVLHCISEIYDHCGIRDYQEQK